MPPYAGEMMYELTESSSTVCMTAAAAMAAAASAVALAILGANARSCNSTAECFKSVCTFSSLDYPKG